MTDTFTPEFAASASYPEIGVAEPAVQARDWPTILALYERSDWELRDRLVRTIAEIAGTEDFFREIVARDPDDLVAATALGTRLISIGWEIRTAKRAKDVSREQFAALHDYLRQAERILIDVCARDPGNAVAWESRQTTSRGLQLGVGESRRRYEHAVRAAPHFLGAQYNHLQQLCPKWSGGTFDKVHAFARECMLAAPPGAHNARLVIDALVEHYIELPAGEDKAYRDSPETRAAVVEAAERSVLHPDFQRTTGWVDTVSSFALGLSVVGAWTEAKQCFLALGNLASLRLWSFYYWRDTETQFRVVRDLALEHG